MDQDIVELIRAGNKIEAIRRYRERYGVGLREAKEAVDAADAGGPLPAPPPRPAVDISTAGGVWESIDPILRDVSKIQAIKAYRERTGVGLKEAKDAVDARARSLGIEGEAKSGCFVATAAFGSPLAAEVAALQRFRDHALLPHPLGRLFVRAYYRLSPPLATWIAGRPARRAAVRVLLRPIMLLAGRVNRP